MPRPTKSTAAAPAAGGGGPPVTHPVAPITLNTKALDDGKILVSVEVAPTPEGLRANGRRPADIVCVVDISGSMDGTYVMQGCFV